MEKLTIKEIEKKLQTIKDQNDPFFQAIKNDGRKGVQRLLTRWQKNYELKKQAEAKFHEMCRFERRLREEGFSLIAGIDEAGRGPLVGPVVAAAVILPETFDLIGVNDSKKLTPRQRGELYGKICGQAVAVGVGIIEADEIDRLNIFEATKKAMLTAVNNLSVAPDYLLIDAVQLHTPYPSESIVKGDSRSISIAAASIVAKVTRDRIMLELDKKFPQYQFAKNMGYGTKEHIEAIKKYGITPYHRRSFAPVKDYCN